MRKDLRKVSLLNNITVILYAIMEQCHCIRGKKSRSQIRAFLLTSSGSFSVKGRECTQTGDEQAKSQGGKGQKSLGCSVSLFCFRRISSDFTRAREKGKNLPPALGLQPQKSSWLATGSSPRLRPVCKFICLNSDETSPQE